jgi:hypothetical protein
MRKISIILAVSLVLVFGLAWQAMAEPISGLTVTSSYESLITEVGGSSSDLNTVPGPYAKVDVFVYSDGTASLEFTALENGLNYYFLGDILGVNLATIDTVNAGTNDSNIVFSAPIPNNAPAFTGQSGTAPANIQALFGDFNLNLSFADGFGQAFKDVSFPLSGDYTGVNAADILALNADGYDAYAHVFHLDFGSDPPTATITGFAAEPVPLPPSALLMGSGLLGLLGLGWRRKIMG